MHSIAAKTAGSIGTGTIKVCAESPLVDKQAVHAYNKII